MGRGAGIQEGSGVDEKKGRGILKREKEGEILDGVKMLNLEHKTITVTSKKKTKCNSTWTLNYSKN